jgi:hypothetical protein
MPETDVNSYMNKLEVLGEEVNNNYLQLLVSNAYNYLNTNNSTVQELVNAINQNLAELNLIQNELSTVNNLNQEALVKKDQLLRMENDDLMKQLRELETIQSTITNKDRLILEINDLLAVIEMVFGEQDIIYQMLKEDKKKKVEKYLKLSKDLGTLN